MLLNTLLKPDRRISIYSERMVLSSTEMASACLRSSVQNYTLKFIGIYTRVIINNYPGAGKAILKEIGEMLTQMH